MENSQSFKNKTHLETHMPTNLNCGEHQKNFQIYMDTKEAAQFLCLSVSALRKWRMINFGPRGIKFGRVVRYRLSDLEAWATAQATVGGSSGGSEP